MGKAYTEGCARCGDHLEVKHRHPEIHSGVHPVGMDIQGGEIWWGMREPRVPQVMCHECIAAMEASGEFNMVPGA